MPLRLSPFISKRTVIFSILTLALLAAASGLHVWRVARLAVEVSEREFASSGNEPASLTVLHFGASPFEPVMSAVDFQSAAEFAGDVYVCGRSALFRYSDGDLKQTWQAGRDLPPSPLISIAVRTGIGKPELWIATEGAGILRFDGRSFRQVLPERETLRNITSLLPLRTGRVLVGTAAGLYVSDGEKLRLFHGQFAKTQVTSLAGNEDQFWIGTRSDGAWRWSGGEAVHFLTELPDPQVLSIATDAQKAWIGTPLGVAECMADRLNRRLADGIFAQAVAQRAGTLWIGTVDQGTLAVPLEPRSPRPHHALENADAQSVAAFAIVGDSVLAVRKETVADAVTGQVLISPPAEGLASAHVTALETDARGHLWIGYFDHGLDVVSVSNLAKPMHLENDVLFCVNRIKRNPRDGTVAVATANGLALLEETGKLRQVIDSSTGLIASHATDLLFQSKDGYSSSMVVATPAGLSFLDAGSLSSMYAFHGLINNHVYTLADFEGTIYAGTLGGVSEVRNGIVQASFTTANSELRQNWITASAVFDGRLYLGTYGSGVVEFNSTGPVTPFKASADHRVEINPNAMLGTGRALYAGTAGQGLAVLRRGEERWQLIREGLPSANVTALHEYGGTLYVGTDNGLVRVLENSLLP